MGEYVELEYWQVALAALLIVVNGVISIALQLRMEKTLLIASARTVVQLLLVGLILNSVFDPELWFLVFPVVVAMTLIAGITAARRNQRSYSGITIDTILSVWVSAWIVTGYAMFAVMQGADSWHQPQYLIPILGMGLGNTLNGITVGLNTFTETLVTRRDHIESLLAIGATRFEASRDARQHAIRTGLIPIINSMMIVGIVSLPGMMTGQIVSGMDPMQAVKYQIVIMFLIASATALGTVLVVHLSFMRIFNHRHQFLNNTLTKKQ